MARALAVQTILRAGNRKVTAVGTPELGPAGVAFWTSTTALYALTDAEFAILHEICRTLDSLDALDRTVRADGPMTVGAAGQPVVHPALTETRGHRVVSHRLIAALNLPDPNGQTVPSARQTRGRTAAATRWSPPLTPTRRTTG